jgi:pSer/pThr/pTyr-binding forkhead associated (FHA) protein
MSQNTQSAKVILAIAQGSLQGQQFTFSERTTCLIGRAGDCNIQLPDDQAHNTISRYHCILDINPPNLRIRDFGSKNGTYVNAKKIGQREDGQTPEEGAKINFPEYDLKTDDLIQLGETVFLVTIESAEIPANIYSLQSAPSNNIDIEALLEKANQGEPDLIAIQGYKIVQKLGKGGFAEVYLALNNQTGELVALKVMLPKVAAMEEYVQKFIREIQLTQALNHPNIVRLRDFGHNNNTIFLTLEYCEGGSVWDLMRHKGGRLSPQEAIFVTLQVLDGLEYAHNAEIPFQLPNGNMGKVNGIVHRDLKPSNLFLTKVDNSVMVKIGDYGLAKAFDLAGLSGLSVTGSSAGTPAFIPRQQIVNFKYTKPDVDVWATAATLYNMLTGVYPRDFEGRDPFNAVLQQDAVPIRQRDPNIPQAVAEVIDLALRDRPEIYFKSAAEFKKALESVL